MWNYFSAPQTLDAFVLSSNQATKAEGCDLTFLLACIDECKEQLAAKSASPEPPPRPSLDELIYRDSLTLDDARSYLRNADERALYGQQYGGRYTPLMCALHYRREVAVRALVLAGADVTLTVQGSPVDIYDTNGSSDYTLYAPHCGTVKLLGDREVSAESVAGDAGMGEVLRKCVEERERMK